jgi:N12 class adenine-specific DNA methylase
VGLSPGPGILRGPVVSTRPGSPRIERRTLSTDTPTADAPTWLPGEGSWLLDEQGRTCQVRDGRARPTKAKPATDQAELEALIVLREAVVEVLAAQRTADDAGLPAAQAVLAERYEAYRTRFGALNRSTTTELAPDPDTGQLRFRRRIPPMGGFRSDPDRYRVLSIERHDEDTGQTEPAAIFTERVLVPDDDAPDFPMPVEDAVVEALGPAGAVDLDRLAQLTGATAEEALDAAGDLIFLDPDLDGWVPAAAYLSGDVRGRWRTARQHVQDGRKDLARNVEALQAALPKRVGPADISLHPSAPWIDGRVHQDFLREVLDTPFTHATYDRARARWTIHASGVDKQSVALSLTWGTPRIDALSLYRKAANQQRPVVEDAVASGGKVRNQAETLAAQAKQEAIVQRFATWAFEDVARSDQLVAAYEEHMNVVVPPHHDGSHLRFPGLNAAFRPRPYQKDATWRMLTGGDTLLDHAVGAGKTATMAMAGMEMRRRGLARKPMYVVPNHLLEQFAVEVQRLYPAGRFLVGSEDVGGVEGRRRFAERCVGEDWDGVIVTHSLFGLVPLSADAEVHLRLDEREELLADPPHSDAVLERSRTTIDAEIIRLRDTLDTDPARFDRLGIDALFVDEAQAFKSLRFATRMKGVAPKGSKRADDLADKVAWLRREVHEAAEATARAVVVFASGTPITNTLAEVYTLQRFLRPERLRQSGLRHFDAWASTFGEVVTAIEVSPDGSTFRLAERFARFVNVPELVAMYRELADVITADEIGEHRPNVVGGSPQALVVPTSEGLAEYMEDLACRARLVEAHEVKPADDNLLKIGVDGRKAALFAPLAGLPESADAGKLDATADHIVEVHARFAERTYLDDAGLPSPRTGCLQVVFCDLGTPTGVTGRAASVYAHLARRLADRGLDPAGIRFVHDAESHAERARLFADCRNGKVTVLVGSTEKLGLGTNIQRRLAAIYHLDAVWRPDSYLQRNGRAVRVGNEHDEVEIVNVTVEGSFDGYVYQAVQRKAAFLEQIRTGRVDERTVDDVGESPLTYAEIKALAVGDPLLLDEARAQQRVVALERAAAVHGAESQRAEGLVAGLRERLSHADTVVRHSTAIIEQHTPTTGERFSWTSGIGTRTTDRVEAGQRLIATLRKLVDEERFTRGQGGRFTLGKLGTVSLAVEVRVERGVRQRRERYATYHPMQSRVKEVELRPTDGQQLSTVLRGITLTPEEMEELKPLPFIRRLERLFGPNLVALRREARADLEKATADLEAAEHALDSPFPQADELRDARADLAEIRRQLSARMTPEPTVSYLNPAEWANEQDEYEDAEIIDLQARIAERRRTS